MKDKILEILNKYSHYDSNPAYSQISGSKFKLIADEIVKLFAIHNVRQQRELLIAYEKTVGAMDINEVEKEVDKYLKDKGN